MIHLQQARPLLEEYAIDDLIDPRLGDRFSENEVLCMLHAANLCIRRDPHSRPRMSHVSHTPFSSTFLSTYHLSLIYICTNNDVSPRMYEKVLRILEGDMVVESGCVSAPCSEAGSRSRRMLLQQEQQSSPAQQDSQIMVDGKPQSYVARRIAWDRDTQSLSHRF